MKQKFTGILFLTFVCFSHGTAADAGIAVSDAQNTPETKERTREKMKNHLIADDGDRHECTSWIVLPGLTEGKNIMLHKNRDADAVKLKFYREALPGKIGWMALGNAERVTANMGINDKGVAVVMNSGDPSDGTSETSGFFTPEIAKIALEESATAAQAVEKIREFVESKRYRHGKKGSIWFAADAREAWIVENDAVRFAAHKVEGSFDIRANTWHFAEMVPFSQLTPERQTNYYRREFAVRNLLFAGGTKYAGPVTVEMIADASRIHVIPEDPACYPLCGKRTNSAATIVTDCEFPESLSSMYVAFGPPRYTLYLPLPCLLKEIPEALTSGRFSDAVFARRDTGAELPEAERNALEREMNQRHRDAVEKARAILRAGGGREKAADLLSGAFRENWVEACAYLGFK